MLILCNINRDKTYVNKIEILYPIFIYLLYILYFIFSNGLILYFYASLCILKDAVLIICKCSLNCILFRYKLGRQPQEGLDRCCCWDYYWRCYCWCYWRSRRCVLGLLLLALLFLFDVNRNVYQYMYLAIYKFTILFFA